MDWRWPRCLEAQRKRLLRLNQMEYERLSGRSLAAASVAQPSVVAFSGRKVIRDEVDAYLADFADHLRCFNELMGGSHGFDAQSLQR